MKKIISYGVWLAALFFVHAAAAQTATIHVDLDKETGEMQPVWAWFGYDEPNYTYMKDGKKLLSEIAALSPVPVYVRRHSLLISCDGLTSKSYQRTNNNIGKIRSIKNNRSLPQTGS